MEPGVLAVVYVTMARLLALLLALGCSAEDPGPPPAEGSGGSAGTGGAGGQAASLGELGDPCDPTKSVLDECAALQADMRTFADATGNPYEMPRCMGFSTSGQPTCLVPCEPSTSTGLISQERCRAAGGTCTYAPNGSACWP